MSEYGYILNPYISVLLVLAVFAGAKITRKWEVLLLLIILAFLLLPGYAIMTASTRLPDNFVHQVYETSREDIVTLDNRPIISGRWRIFGAGELNSVMYYSYYTPSASGIQLHEIPATDTRKESDFSKTLPPKTITRIFEDAPLNSAYILQRRVSGHESPWSTWNWRVIYYRGHSLLYEVHVLKGSLAFAVNLKINGGE